MRGVRIPKYPRSRPERTLLPHQIDILKYMMGTRTPALFIDMRLGKTILTIEYAIRKGLKNILVLAPKSALNSWEAELQHDRQSYFRVERKDRLEGFSSSRWVLTNPQKLQTYGIIFTRTYDLVVVDESSRIKNARSKYYKTIVKRLSYVPHKILLSGTPTPEDILEAVPQLIFLRGEALGCKSYWEFLAKYTIRFGYDRYLMKSARSALMQTLKSTCYFLSQKEAGIAQPRQLHYVPVEKTAQQKALFKKLKSDFELDVNGKHYETTYILTVLTWATRIAGGMLDGECLSTKKYEALKSIVDSTNGQLVVWFRFNEELLYVQERLSREGVSCRAYYGEVSTLDRKRMEKEFKEKKYKVLLLQVKTGLYALDLSSADTAVYYSNSWSLEERLQSEKRISHPRKSSTLHYYDLVMDGWPDTTVYKALLKKNISANMIWENRPYGKN